MVFPRTEADRAATGDPRPSVEARYPTFESYHRKVAHAIDRLIERRLMLCEDAASEETRLMQLGVDKGVPAPAGGVLPVPEVPSACEPKKHHGKHHGHDNDHGHHDHDD